MDPLTLFFTSYLEAVSDRAYAQMSDESGVETQQVMVAHNNHRISYQYRFWEIQDETVCADKREHVGHYSECTIAAKSLFERACKRLLNNPEEHWKYSSLKEMYCTAADYYEPTIATIDWSYEKETRLSAAKRECSAAVAAAIGSRDPRILNERDVKCRIYKQVKEQYSDF
ncbi:hypothetical protein ACFL0R_02130 [Pseudomonadota bacterium]